MENKPNNPSAFPTHPDSNIIDEGMTLRDYFASKAMQATINQMLSREYSAWEDDAVVEYSYRIADLMLKQREL